MKVHFIVMRGLDVRRSVFDADALPAVIGTKAFEGMRVCSARYILQRDLMVVELEPRAGTDPPGITPGYQEVVSTDRHRKGRIMMRFSDRCCAIRRE